MNVVLAGPDGVVEKVASPAIRAAYRSLAREAAACEAVARLDPGLAPSLVRRDSSQRLLLGLLPGVPQSSLRRALDVEGRRRLSRLLGRTLARVHAVPVHDAPPELRLPSAGATWAQRVVAALADAAEAAGAYRPALRSIMRAAARWGAGRLELLTGAGEDHLVHGDFGGANILIRPRPLALSGVVDWEWACVGDADLDLVRIEWLPLVGRSAHLWSDDAERSEFYAGYGARGPCDPRAGRYAVYSLWLAVSHLNVGLRRGWLDEPGPLLGYVERTLAGG